MSSEKKVGEGGEVWEVWEVWEKNPLLFMQLPYPNPPHLPNPPHPDHPPHPLPKYSLATKN
ncbi:MAG: hypothetical protein F6K40_17115 [Okeania sp. SIO3I5]|uniref:hypothetical protein n=1 Tax=Okeania sp. SIO3I5 TaxID=2607805 RepID=UPI0013B6124C|nr:hypothetical protein [Okeania sp. SIO3I5]NEQ37885.1 hypothetical protein [Okeania sp. SIO3I5]